MHSAGAVSYTHLEEEDALEPSKFHAFTNYAEVILAYALNQVQIHDFIKVDIPGHGLVITTPGRLIFNLSLIHI